MPRAIDPRILSSGSPGLPGPSREALESQERPRGRRCELTRNENVKFKTIATLVALICVPNLPRTSPDLLGVSARLPGPSRKTLESSETPQIIKTNRIIEVLPSSHYYLGSLSWTSRAFYFLDSRDLLEVLRDFLGIEREGGGSLGDLPER